uniref:SusC/RagA family TonB-linked outer membrane protein n=1 Tax=Pedobacter schmidteae TaxID=2201271 RepID=UPI0018D51550|nr:TonB-dependent receptor [Pedobacter schmidteae]
MYRRNFIWLRVKYLCYLLLLMATAFKSVAQSNTTITGKVTDVKGGPLPGVSVTVKGSTNGGVTDGEGKYAIKLTSGGATLVFTFVGYKKQEIAIAGRKTINVELKEDDNSLEEVNVVVAYGTQKKESMVSAITSINPKELKGPTSNLTTMLAGRVSGMVAYQRSGEPGKDNASFFIRGVGSFGAGKIDPLILIDGMESTPNDLARLQPDDIAGFSVLKDAAASSLYGARGANGVILVNTKSGSDGKTKFNFRAENSVSSNTENFKLADNITYMKMANEAVLTRNPLGVLPYSQTKIDRTAAGMNPLLYPNNDWIKALIKDYTLNQRFNMNMNGGGKVAQYYIAGTYNIDNGVLKNEALNKYDNNIKLKSYQVRSNVNVKLTPTTEGIVRTSGSFDDYSGPIGGGSGVFDQALSSNPVLFPAFYPASALPLLKHPLFGNSLLSDSGGSQLYYNNPYANMVSGFQEYNTSTLNIQLEIKQDFNFITKGLTARAMTYTQRYSYFDLTRQYNPFFYSATPTDSRGENYNLSVLNPLTGTEYLNYNGGGRKANTTSYMEAAVNYNRTFNEKHAIGGLLVTTMRNYLTTDGNDLQSSLPARNQGLSGRLTYGYDNRYLFEANFGYNGSERFARNNRYGFFPSVGVAWNMANEKFFAPLSSAISKLKFRATYGLIGNDQIGRKEDRFFYLANVNLNEGLVGRFGTDYGTSRPAVTISRYPNEYITWEKTKTTNLGMDLTLFNSLNLVFEAYKSHRSNILMTRSTIPTTMGLAAAIQANVGEAESKGIDVSLDYNKTFGKVWVQGRGTFTYASSKLLVNEEPNYGANLAYLSKVGNSLGQAYGYIAERLFVDDEEVRNSPKQNFGEVKGGDIKYRDINNDGQITSLDIVPLGLPTTPEIVYGFGLSAGYKNFDISGFFQGSTRSSFWIDPAKITPFVIGGASGNLQNGLLKSIADSYWSEDNRNMQAFWPRLSPNVSANNTQTSNWWMRNGSFLRLKSVELGYNLSGKSVAKLGIGSIRVYASGTNLFVKSSFKMWDPEQGSNGLGYPLQKVFNFGVNVQF